MFKLQVFLDPGNVILQKLGDDCPCECDAPPHGLGWASHHQCEKWREICKANDSRLLAQSQEWAVLGLARLLAKQKGVGPTWTNVPYC